MTREQLKQARRRRRAILFLLAVLAVLAATITVALSTGTEYTGGQALDWSLDSPYEED